MDTFRVSMKRDDLGNNITEERKSQYIIDEWNRNKVVPEHAAILLWVQTLLCDNILFCID